MNKKLISVLSALALLAVAIPVHADGMVFSKTLLKFHTMVGNAAPYINVNGAGMGIRGILGGPMPWDLTRAVGELKANGDLHIRIQGLIIPEPYKPNINPQPYFQAVVSCRTLTADANGNYYRNMVTPKSDTRMIGNPTLGDAVIDGNVDLPPTCIAPIVFVTSPAGVTLNGITFPTTGFWFAATGDQTASSAAGGD